MELVLLGTGCPQCDPARRGPSNLLRARGRQYLVDCGSGVTQRLVEAGTKGAALDALFLTHLHTEHLVDFYQLVISAWHQGRARPWRVYGPPGTRAFVDGTMALWAAERAQRIAHEKRASTAGFEMDVREIAAGEILSEDGVRVHAVAVEHQPVKFAFGYVFEADGHKIAFSGDTARSRALIDAARGADALVHECFLHAEMPVVPGVRSAETVAAVGAYHTRSDEVGKIAREAGAKLLVLNHFVPTRFDPQKLLDEVGADFAGPVAVGEDLMRFDCATRRLSYPGGTLALGA